MLSKKENALKYLKASFKGTRSLSSSATVILQYVVDFANKL